MWRLQWYLTLTTTFFPHKQTQLYTQVDPYIQMCVHTRKIYAELSHEPFNCEKCIKSTIIDAKMRTLSLLNELKISKNENFIISYIFRTNKKD